jgi:hypothetical protein
MSVPFSDIDPSFVSSFSDNDRFSIAKDIFYHDENTMFKTRFFSILNLCWTYFGMLSRDEKDSSVYLDKNMLPELQQFFYNDFWSFKSVFFANETIDQVVKILGIDRSYNKKRIGYEGIESLVFTILLCPKMRFDDYTLCFPRR